MSLRILHAIRSFVPRAGSVATTLPGLFRQLRQRDMISTVITLEQDPHFDPGVPVVWCDPTPADGAFSNSDVIHLHGFEPAFAVKISQLAKHHNKPLVFSPLGALTPNPLENPSALDRLRRNWSQRRVLHAAAAVTCLNRVERAGLLKIVPSKRLLDVFYGIDFREFDPPTRAEADANADDPRIILFLNPMHPIEGLVPLLKAIGELGTEAKDWHSVVAGPQIGEWKRQIQAAVERKGGADRITFVIDPDLDTQREWLTKASLVVAPSLRIRSPVTVCHALAAGVPLLTTDHGLPPGLEPCVRTCQPNRVAIRDALHQMLTSPAAQRREQAAKNRAASRAVIDWSNLTDSFATMYEQIIRRSMTGANTDSQLAST